MRYNHSTYKLFFSILFFISISSKGQTNALEFSAGAGNPTGNGPTVSDQIITLQDNTNNPSGNTFSAYTPAKNVTFSLTNHLRTMSAFPNVGLMFGGTVSTTVATPTPFSLFPLISGIGGSSNSHYTSINSISGSGIDIASNNSVAFYTSLYPLFESNTPLPTPGNPIKLQYADIVITFNTPTSNPILHLTGAGGGIGDLLDPDNIVIGYSPEFQLVTPGLSFTRLSGSSEFIVPNTTEILNNASFPFGITGQGGMSGSVMVNGTNITTITLRVYIKIVDHPNASLPYWSNTSTNKIQSGDVFLIGVSTELDSNLSISKTVDNNSPMVGDTVVFTILATNNGPNNDTNVQIQDLLPSGFTYVSHTVSSGGGTYSNSNGLWDIENLDNGVSRTLTITATVNASGNYTNIATISGNNNDNNLLDNTAFVTSLPQIDTDNDGVFNINDLDDDNDGILDTTEMQTCASGGFLSLNGYSGKLWDILEDDSWNLFDNSIGFPENLILKGTFDYQINSNTQQSLDINFLNYQLNNFNSYSEFNNFNGQNIQIGASDAAIEFTKIISNEEEGIYNININNSDNFLFIYVNNNLVYKKDFFVPPTLNLNPLTLQTGDVVKIVVIEDHEINTSLDLNFIKTSSLNLSQALCFIDSDNDSIPNHLDIDSDNDGCGDAAEYYNSNTFDSDLDGFYGTGMPTVDANGLVVGASYSGSLSNVLNAGSNSIITSHPIDQSLFLVNTATFNASLTNGSGTTTLQWEESTNGGLTWNSITNDGNYSGANSTSLTINNITSLMDNYSYRLVVSQSDYVCSNITSNVAQIIILTDNDNDLIADTIDLDDDNDGIYDIEECDVTLNANNFNLFAPYNFQSPSFDIWNINVSGNSGTLVQFNNQEFSIPASGVLVISLNESETPILQENVVESGKSFTLTANQPITVLHELAGGAVSDSWIVLPQSLWGTNYRLFSYDYIGNAQNYQYAMVYSATNNNSITFLNKSGVVQKTITLNEGQTYLQSVQNQDMTGWTVTSTEKIAIIVGVKCANGSAGFCDNIDEMLLPTNQLGTKFYVPNGANNTTYVMANEPNTVVTVNNTIITTLTNSGDVYSFPVLNNELNIVETSKPSTVWQLTPNNNDPSWLLVLDSQKAVTSFNFATPSSMINTNIISLIVPTVNTSQIRLNGNPVSGWNAYPSEPSMSYAEISGFAESTNINVYSTTGNIPILSSYTGTGNAVTNSTVPSLGNLDVSNGNYNFNNCQDFDNDGIADYLDTDSDNDGCSDANEYYNNPNADGGEDEIFGNGNPIINPNGTVQGAGYAGNYTNVTSQGILSSIITQPTNQETLVNENISFNTTTTQGSGNSTYQWQQSIDNGSTWTNIIDNTTFSGSQTLNLSIVNVNASMHNYQYRIVISESNFICDTITSQPASIIILTDFDNDSIADIYDVDDDNDGILDTIEGTTDFDNDGFPNHQDLDADNDGCSDAYEAGTTIDTTSNYQFDTTATANGSNGFHNSLETALDNGIYIGTYTYTYSINDTLNACCPQIVPTLSSTSETISCTIGSIDLNTLVTSSLPASSSLLWFDNINHTGASLAMPITSNGTYYAIYQNTINNCFGPVSTAVTVQFTTVPQGVPNFTSNVTGSTGTISAAMNNGINENCGGMNSWSNTSNTGTSNNAYTSITLDKNSISNCLDFKNFTISIPNNTIISGIQVRMERSKTGDFDIQDNIIQLIDGSNNLMGVNMASTTNWSTTDAIVTYGNSTNNWGANLTANDINTSNFGIRISVKSGDGIDFGNAIAQIDRLQLFLYYIETPEVCNNDEIITVQTTGVLNATNYNWTIPNGATIVSGNGTNSVSIQFPSASTIGLQQICVTPTNECGDGITSCLPIFVKNCSITPFVLENDFYSTTFGTFISLPIYDNDTNIPTAGTISFSNTANGVLTIFNSGSPNNPSDDTFSYIPNIGFYGNDIIYYTVCDANIPQNCDTKTITIEVEPRTFYIKALLQGSLFGNSNNIMRDDLRTKNLIPLTEPYTAKWNNGNQRFFRPDFSVNETTTTDVLVNRGDNSIVDWVFIELRDPLNKNLILHTQAALIQKDGDIVDAFDGLSPIKFRNLNKSSYHIAIKHRNHLGVMTNLPITFTNNVLTFDFSTAIANTLWNSSTIHNGSEQIFLNDNKYALWAGNSNSDYKIKYSSVSNDQSKVFTDIISFQYNTASNYNYNGANAVYEDSDLNLDGKIKYRGPNNDSNFIFFNVMTKYQLNSAFIYNFDILTEQIPN